MLYDLPKLVCSDYKHHREHLKKIDQEPVVKTLNAEKDTKRMIKYNSERRAQSKSFLKSGKLRSHFFTPNLSD